MQPTWNCFFFLNFDFKKIFIVEVIVIALYVSLQLDNVIFANVFQVALCVGLY
jgi:hypothetical protein